MFTDPRLLVAAAVVALFSASANAAPNPSSGPGRQFDIASYGAVSDGKTLNTAAIQRALDDCGAKGGGRVRVPAGVFLTGGLHLRSNVTLHLDKEAVLRGSDDPRDYGGQSLWSDALLTGANLENVQIEGSGTLDGADVRNPRGEEGFRGPHCVSLTKCKNTVVRDITIVRSSNWAFNCKDCSGARIERLKVRGGHDGFDVSECERFTFKDCDFRTGDDCIAGAGNTDCIFTGCYFNSSCNGFRFACIGMTVRNCRFVGPGEYLHRSSKRTNMLSAFVHFSPEDRGYRGLVPHSDRWLIEKCTVVNADNLYEYNYKDGGWETGRPVKGVVFRDIAATGLIRPIRIVGDSARQLDFTLERVRLAFVEGHTHQPQIEAHQFGTITLKDVTLINDGGVPVLTAADGDHLTLDTVRCEPSAHPFEVARVADVKQRNSPAKP